MSFVIDLNELQVLSEPEENVNFALMMEKVAEKLKKKLSSELYTTLMSWSNYIIQHHLTAQPATEVKV